MGLRRAINDIVGKGGKNNKSDVATIVDLLNDRKKARYYQGLMSNIEVPRPTDKDIESKLVKAIHDFQQKVQLLKLQIVKSALMGPQSTYLEALDEIKNR